MQRHDRRRPGHRHHHRRRRRAGPCRSTTSSRHRGQRRHRTPTFTVSCSARPAARRSRSTTPPPTARAWPRPTTPTERHARDLRPRRDHARPSPSPSRATRRRGRRDLLRQPEQLHQRHHRRRPGPRHHPRRRRYAAISINDVTVTEGNTGTINAVFTVTLSAASDQTVTVDCATADGTATTAGSDYTAVSGTRHLRARARPTQDRHRRRSRATRSTRIQRDLLRQPHRRRRTPPITDGQGDGTITDDDDAAAARRVNDVDGDRGQCRHRRTSTFTVTLSAASGHAVTVQYATADGTAVAPARLHRPAAAPDLRPRAQTTRTVSRDGHRRHCSTRPTRPFLVNLSSRQRHDRRRPGQRHDHRRRPAPTSASTTSRVDRGRQRHQSCQLHRRRSARPAARRSRVAYSHRQRHRHRRQRLHGRQRRRHFRPGQTRQTIHRAGHRRPARRCQRRLLRQPRPCPANATIADGQGMAPSPTTTDADPHRSTDVTRSTKATGASQPDDSRAACRRRATRP